MFKEKLGLSLRMFMVDRFREFISKEIKRCLNEGTWKKDYLRKLMDTQYILMEHYNSLYDIHENIK